MRATVPSLTLAVVLLGACSTAPKGWHKSGASAADLQRDEDQCRYEAKAATASYSTTPSQPGAAAATGRAIGDGIVVAEKQIDLANECMKARGYMPK
jgi:hypothetical protein